MTDAVREAFERIALPNFAVPNNGLIEDHWQTWQEAWEEATRAALSEQPEGRCYCDERGIGEPGVTCGDCPRDYGHRVATHPAPVERVTLSDEQLIRAFWSTSPGVLIQQTLTVTRWKDGIDVNSPTMFMRDFACAVIAEYERANGIGKGEQA